MEYQASGSYPSVRVEKKNKYYANLLLKDYAGVNSELTAITQYVYQDFSNFESYPDFAEVMDHIAMVEMRHLELLGKTIKLLGVNPEYRFNNNTFWESKFVNYSTDIISMLNSNILEEQITIMNYKYHQNIIKDKYIKELIARIVEDEKVHIKCFEELLKKYSE